MFLYADDVLLLHPINSSQDMVQVQSDLDLLNNWLISHHLTLNPSKYIFFSFKTQASFDTVCTPHISNAPLERVLSYNYLGVTISYNLSWSSHVHNLCKKARKLIGFLYRNFYKVHHLLLF